eukprot:gnl/MRDRNA2_/MRDRNA2_23375_c0_seq1.p1 gnl/MRDRNA2_/MRDRNA2_23375_c0~~gnl/MRDRNA2_/MRDRNA2_23375_c0_seq1.p1  ORF type:complete len:105 (-),score=19.89 gnl/MRDRNA2_/MRDRNA2_23375_c0_seq1:16-330(-)
MSPQVEHSGLSSRKLLLVALILSVTVNVFFVVNLWADGPLFHHSKGTEVDAGQLDQLAGGRRTAEADVESSDTSGSSAHGSSGHDYHISWLDFSPHMLPVGCLA